MMWNAVHCSVKKKKKSLVWIWKQESFNNLIEQFQWPGTDAK